MLLVNVSGKAQNVDTEHIGKVLTENIFQLFSDKTGNLVKQYLLAVTNEFFYYLLN